MPFVETLFYNILHLIELRDQLCSVVRDLPEIQRYIQKAFIRWIFIMNTNGLFKSFKLLDLQKFKLLIIEQLKYTEINRSISLQNVIEQIEKKKLLVKSQQNNILADPFVIRKTGSAAACTYTFLTPQVNNRFHEKKFTVRLHEKQLRHLRSLYNGTNFLIHAYLLGFFYTHVDNPNMHLSFGPAFLHKHKIDFELFGTPLNTSIRNQYCSPLDFEQQYFQSKGSFFHFDQFSAGKRYTANAPFDETLLLDMVVKLFNVLQHLQVTFYLTIPVWDLETKTKLKMDKDERFTQQDFAAYQYLMSNYEPYIKLHTVYNTNEFDYYDYYQDKIRGIVPIHFFIVSSDPTFVVLSD